MNSGGDRMKVINLKTISRQMFDDINLREGINYFEGDYQDGLENFYKQNKAKFGEIMSVLRFAPELLKEDEKVEKSFTIPIQDAEFVEWCILQYTERPMKAVRRGKYYVAGSEYIGKLIDGFCSMLMHLDKRETVIIIQREMMEQETDYPFMKLFENLQGELEFAISNMFKIIHSPNLYMTWEHKIGVMNEILLKAKMFNNDIQSVASYQIEKDKKDIIENAFSIPIQQNPERINLVYLELYSNPEFQSLKKEYDEIEESNGFLEKKNKKRKKIVAQMNIMFQEVASRYPIVVDKLSDIEKLLLISEDRFQLKCFSGHDRIFVIENELSDRYYRRFWSYGDATAESDDINDE